ncbi:Holliday junction branch migration protein RuvA [Rickettsiales bacterium LUAb2]
MIGKLIGKIDYISDDYIIVDVNGVGYLVYIPQNIMARLNLQESVVLFIETQVREDSITLFGFTEEIDKKVFNLLKTVQGVGAKLALAALSRLSTNDLQTAIMLEDQKLIQTIPGVGAKVAIRIISELKGKIDKLFAGIVVTNNIGNNGKLNKNREAREALLALGYGSLEVNAAINYAINELEELATVEDVIKKSLQYFNDKLKK